MKFCACDRGRQLKWLHERSVAAALSNLPFTDTEYGCMNCSATTIVGVAAAALRNQASTEEKTK
jgi:hypothetical protein